ncbi:MAG: FGGY-family carbohydrate kinase, partial [Pseudomonadota bacterium]
WFCQRLADLMARPVERPVVTETTALGAAMLAAVGSGALPDLRSLARMWQLDQDFSPALPASDRAAALDQWSAAVARARGAGPATVPE